MSWRAAVFGAVLCAAWSHASSARAQASDASETPEQARARELFRDGNALAEQGKFARALERFEAAYALWNNPKIELNIATSLRALGRHAEALRAYRDYLSQAEPNSERRAEVEAICAELEARVAHVRLRVAAGVERLSLDGSPLDPSDRHELILEPGHHVVSAGTPAGEHDVNFDVAEGERRELSVEGPAPAEPSAEAPADPFADSEASRREPAPFGVTTRLDVDGRGRGVVGAAGLVYAFDAHWQLSAGGLVGKRAGAWAGVEVFLFEGPLRPSLGLSAPVFFVSAPTIGVSADAGVRWAASDSFFVSVRAALVHFPTVPDGYERTVFVPSIGSELRL